MSEKVTLKEDEYRLALMADKDSETGRPILNCLCLEDGKIKVADGFKLAWKEAKTFTRPVNIPVKVFQHFQGEIELELLDGQNQVRITGKAFPPDTISVVVDLYDGKMPSFDDALALTGEAKAEIALGTRLLEEMLEALPIGILKLRIPEPEGAVEFVFYNNADTIRGAIMPMLVEWGNENWETDKLLSSKKGEREGEGKQGNQEPE